jgi:3'-phosphoadenosine 5'-phosphosulfate sulfotransferase (PAPS reductase)/FAD synthetase
MPAFFLEAVYMISLILYSTVGCHLCELAEEQLRQAQQQFDLRWRWTEIVDSEELMERYSLRIPVVVEPASGEEMGWPFTQPELQTWLAQLT